MFKLDRLFEKIIRLFDDGDHLPWIKIGKTFSTSIPIKKLGRSKRFKTIEIELKIEEPTWRDKDIVGKAKVITGCLILEGNKRKEISFIKTAYYNGSQASYLGHLAVELCSLKI